MSKDWEELKASWGVYWQARKTLRSNEASQHDKLVARAIVPPLEVTTLVNFATTGFLTFSAVGAIVGGKNASMQHRAENLHIVPKSRLQAFNLVRDRNYKIWLGAMRRGTKLGALGALYFGTWYTLEVSASMYRHKKDLINTTFAGAIIGAATAMTSHSWAPVSLLLNTTFPVAIGLSYRGLQSLADHLQMEQEQIAETPIQHEAPIFQNIKKKSSLDAVVSRIEADVQDPKELP